MNTETKQRLLEFMDGRFLCVLSTVDPSSRPESALVAYSVGTGLELMIGTSKLSRKAKNISSNGAVAVVIGDETGEVQYEGRAVIIKKAEYDQLVREGRFKQLAGSAKYRDDPDQIWLRIKPDWVRFIEHGQPDKIEEFTEFV